VTHLPRSRRATWDGRLAIFLIAGALSACQAQMDLLTSPPGQPSASGDPTPAAESNLVRLPMISPGSLTLRTKPGSLRSEIALEAVLSPPPNVPLKFSWSSPDGSLAGKSGRFVTWTNKAAPRPEPYRVLLSLTVSAADGSTESATIEVWVRPDSSVVLTNHPPVITQIRATKGSPSSTLVLTAEASDTDQDQLTYGWAALRGKLSGMGRQVTWTPDGDTPGVEGITLSVMDVSGESDRAALIFHTDSNGQTDLPGFPSLPTPVLVVPEISRHDLILPEGVRVEGVLAGIMAGQPMALDAPDTDGRWESAFTPSTQLTARVRLSNGQDSSAVRWSSSDPARVRVDASGRVTALADASPGPVAITATSFVDPTRSATVELLVRGQGLIGITIQ